MIMEPQEDWKLIDCSQKASLRFRKFDAHFDTVTEALLHWERLSLAERGHVALSLEDGLLLQAFEIERLNEASKSKSSS
jgi:hypothetical protein